jgi:hypothetical protein
LVHPGSVLAEIDQQFPENLGRVFDFLRFASIGTDPARHAGGRQAEGGKDSIFARRTGDGKSQLMLNLDASAASSAIIAQSPRR